MLTKNTNKKSFQIDLNSFIVIEFILLILIEEIKKKIEKRSGKIDLNLFLMIHNANSVPMFSLSAGISLTN